MPDPKRIDKREEMLRAAVSKVERGDTRASVSALYDKIRTMQENHSRLTVEETTDLLKKYAVCSIQLRKQYLKYRGRNTKKSNMYLSLMKKFSKDFSALNRYRSRLKKGIVKPVRIESFYEASRTRTVSLDGKALSELGSAGGNSNVRYRVSVPMISEGIPGLSVGDHFRGYFTENNSYPAAYSDWDMLHQQELKIAENIEKNYPLLKKYVHPGKNANGPLNALVQSIFTSDADYRYRKTTAAEFMEKGKPEAYLNGLIRGIQNGEINADDDAPDLLRILGSIKDHDKLSAAEKRKPEAEQKRLIHKRKIEKQDMIYGLSEYLEEMLKACFANHAVKSWGLDAHRAHGQRNALMSSIAGVLGISDVVAYSEKMNIRSLENGKEVVRKGVFMVPASGDDPTHTHFNSPLASFDRTRTEDSPGLNRKIASLQLLDWICGNVDRHAANFFYQFDKTTGKLTGIQAIDNDTAFGAGNDYENNGRSYFVRFEDMRVIPKSMADAVKDLDTDMLGVLLQGHDLAEEEINATLKRFNRLKKELARSEKIYKDAAPGYLDSHTPRIVPDEELDSYSLSEQLTAKPGDHKERKNLFAKVTELQDHRTSLATAVSDSLTWLAEAELKYHRAFAAEGPGSLKGQLRELKALAGNEGAARRNILVEEDAPVTFTDVIRNVESLLGDRAIRESLLEPSGNYLHFGSPGIKLYKFKGSEDLRTDEEKLSGSTTPLTPEQIDQTNREHPVYQKLLSAYDAASGYLQDQSETGMKYQELQMDLKAAKGKAHKEAVKAMNTFKKTADFRKYMAVLTMRNRLSEQLERFTDIQKESYELQQTPGIFNRITRALNDPYMGSRLQEKGHQKAADALAAQRKVAENKMGINAHL